NKDAVTISDTFTAGLTVISLQHEIYSIRVIVTVKKITIDLKLPPLRALCLTRDKTCQVYYLIF
ncbi:hypothetical protein DVA76_19330, partial [Acinetobacter baumannii]